MELELKLVADVGIVGVPNSGKSIFLSAISVARPEVANYPFTTFLPKFGVVPIGYDASMVVADLPGHMEGAHQGIEFMIFTIKSDLRHEFLRHTERCSVLVQVVDGTCAQAVEEYEAVRLELQLFNPELSEKLCRCFQQNGYTGGSRSMAIVSKGLGKERGKDLLHKCCYTTGNYASLWAAFELLQSQRKATLEEEEIPEDALQVGEVVKKLRDAN